MESNRSSTTRRGAIAVGVVGLCILLLWLFVWWNRPPQMGAHQDVFRTVDALFTAVTAHDEKLLRQCEQQLHTHRGAGKLPANALNYLDGIIKRAREGRWQAAAESLYNFMKAQRREGMEAQSTKKEKGRSRAGQ